MAEFAYNNSTTAGNGMSPFYANYGFHPIAGNQRRWDHSTPPAKPMPTGCTPCTMRPGKDWKKRRSEYADTLIRRERNLMHIK